MTKLCNGRNVILRINRMQLQNDNSNTNVSGGLHILVEENQLLAQLMNAIQDATRTIQQAEASGNIQQMYEAERVLYLTQQRLQQVQTEMSPYSGNEDEQAQLQAVKDQLVDGGFATPSD